MFVKTPSDPEGYYIDKYGKRLKKCWNCGNLFKPRGGSRPKAQYWTKEHICVECFKGEDNNGKNNK